MDIPKPGSEAFQTLVDISCCPEPFLNDSDHFEYEKDISFHRTAVIMKILYTNFHRGDGGGHTTYILSLARELGSEHEIVIAAPRGSRLFESAAVLPGVRTMQHEFKGGLLKTLLGIRCLRAFLRREQFDIIHVNGAADHRACMFALIGSGTWRPVLVYSQHSDRLSRSVGALARAKLATDHVICVCDHTRKKLVDSYFSGCRLHVIRNGVDLDRFVPPSREERLAAKRCWIPTHLAGRLVVGSNAGTAAYKNWLDMVEAVSLLPSVLRSQIVILIAGVLPSDAQRARVEALNLRNSVVFTGLLDDVRSCLAALDVGFVVSSEIETISFACREMMAMGIPVIVSDAGGLPENVENGHDGWIVPIRDPQAIASVLTKVLESPTDLVSMGQRARQKAVQEFSIGSFVSSTQEVYQRGKVSPKSSTWIVRPD